SWRHGFTIAAVAALSYLGCKSRFDSPQYFYEPNHVGFLEHAFNAIAVEIGEGGLIEQFRVHDAARGEMVDDEVKKFELIGSKAAAFQEFSEGALGGLPVEPYERADETGQPAVGLERAERRFVNASLEENTFKLL